MSEITDRHFDQLKPRDYKDWLTIGQLAKRVDRRADYLRLLTRQGKLPDGIRHKTGKLEIRLYSPKQVEAIERHFRQKAPARGPAR